jgi:hypothetical protein
VKYSKDLDASEVCLEIFSFKHQIQTLLAHVESATPVEHFQLVEDSAL